MKNIFLYAVLFILVFSLNAQAEEVLKNKKEDVIPLKSEKTEELKSEEKTIEAKEDEKKKDSDYEQKLETIKYGLNSDIIKLVQTLQTENDLRFNSELQKVFEKEKNISVKREILKFFAFQKNDALKDAVCGCLENVHEYNTDLLTACIRYLVTLEVKSPSVLSALHKIIDGDQNALKEAAILALGKLGTNEDAVYLTEVFNKHNFDDTPSLIIRQTILLALIDLHASETFDFLEELATDSYENTIIRARALTALGKLANEKAVKVLVKAFEDADPLIREACIAGLSGFPGNAEAEEILLQAFKDEYYKVRLQAIATAVENKNCKSIPYILFRAKSDPEGVVKNKAIEAIAKSSDADAQAWLKETFLDESYDSDRRIKIAYEVLKNNPDLIIADLEKAIVEALSDNRKKSFAYNLGKNISTVEDIRMAKICEAFLLHKESKFKSIGLDMFQVNRFPDLISLVEEIANDKKNGALQKRASRLLEEKSSGSTDADVSSEKSSTSDKASDKTDSEIRILENDTASEFKK